MCSRGVYVVCGLLCLAVVAGRVFRGMLLLLDVGVYFVDVRLVVCMRFELLCVGFDFCLGFLTDCFVCLGFGCVCWVATWPWVLG